MARLLQLDCMRGIAIILMVLFNWSFALSFLGLIESYPTHAMRLFSASWLYWWLFPRAVGALFITIAGISMALSYDKIKDKTQPYIYKKYIIRGLKIFLLGEAITVITYFIFPSYTIWFGILHLIGLSMLLSSLVIKYNKINLALGMTIIILGFYIQNMSFMPQLLWVLPFNFTTFDYFPMLPWTGFMLVGMFIGKNYFVKMKSAENKILSHSVAFIGRHSLVIYITHQPLLLLILYLLGFTII